SRRPPGAFRPLRTSLVSKPGINLRRLPSWPANLWLAETDMGDFDIGETDRRGFLKCIGWAGTGLVWTVAGGVAASVGLAAAAETRKAAPFSFFKISASHIGFSKPFNPDTRVTYREAVAKIAALPTKPDFIFHTGDITQLSKDEQFDDADQILKEAGITAFHIP